ncbi:MAG: phosphonopyruvate decarboxylase [Gammaproteobacteria bacterium]|nr:phosphonopyruvate decarboxylase [Gammaproteobacteria bacterium]
MINASAFLKPCLERGFDFFTGTPCSYLKPFINYVIDKDEFKFIDATNEGDAVAMAAGVTLAGRRSIVMFQNSGLGNAVNPLTSLAHIFQIPLLLIVSHRGNPAGEKDEPQHDLMGRITTQMLDVMQIRWAPFPNQSELVEDALMAADDYLTTTQRPFAFVMQKGDVESYNLEQVHSACRVTSTIEKTPFALEYAQRANRADVLAVIQAVTGDGCALIATTGFTGRELYAHDDRENQLYMVGSMGCALPLGFGIAHAKPDVRVYVVDGDGALLMRTGAMATVGNLCPGNLIHILLDNEVHDSTGGQSTVSGSVDFTDVAKGFGYRWIFATDSLDQFTELMTRTAQLEGPVFIHFKTRKGAPGDLVRPSITPVEVKERFMNYLKNIA